MIIFGLIFDPYIRITSLVESTSPELFGKVEIPPFKKIHHRINRHFVSRNRNVQRRHVPVSRHK